MIQPAVPLIIFGIVAVLSAVIMIFLPESKGCELPKSLIDGETIGLFGDEKEKVASRYQKPPAANGSLNFKEWADKEGVGDINLNDVELKKRSVSVIAENDE